MQLLKKPANKQISSGYINRRMRYTVVIVPQHFTLVRSQVKNCIQFWVSCYKMGVGEYNILNNGKESRKSNGLLTEELRVGNAEGL